MAWFNNCVFLVVINFTPIMEWFDEKIPRLARGNWIYKLACFITFRRKRKLSYKEYYIMLCEINRKKMGIEKAKKASIIKVLDLYKDLHDGKYPIGYDEQ